MTEKKGNSREEKASILIVDDNISLCKTMSFILRHEGYAVITARGGPEAIDKVRERPFNMVFMDIKMPLMDGVEAYKRIKEIRPEAVVMMMTAYAVEDMVQESLNNGAYTCLYKPLDMAEVIKLVDDIWERKQKAG